MDPTDDADHDEQPDDSRAPPRDADAEEDPAEILANLPTAASRQEQEDAHEVQRLLLGEEEDNHHHHHHHPSADMPAAGEDPQAETSTQNDASVASPSKAVPKRKTSRRNPPPTFQELFFELMKFRAKHGHLRVPKYTQKSMKTLSKWISQVREEYSRYQEKSETYLKTNPMQNEMQRDANGKENKTGDPYQPAPSLMVGKPKGADSSSGHLPGTMASSRPPPLPALLPHEDEAQRRGSPNFMLTASRILVLNSIGFSWDMVNHDSDSKWNVMFQQLVTYKEANGHCNVPQNSGKLGFWVKSQREQYREAQLKKAGKPLDHRKQPYRTALSKERIEKLEALGIEWRITPPSAGWDARYQELINYYETAGSTNVPINYPLNRQLGRWVGKQRAQYSLKQRGKQSQLTQERIDKLNAINFSWGSSNNVGNNPHAADVLQDDAQSDVGGQPLGLATSNKRKRDDSAAKDPTGLSTHLGIMLPHPTAIAATHGHPLVQHGPSHGMVHAHAAAAAYGGHPFPGGSFHHATYPGQSQHMDGTDTGGGPGDFGRSTYGAPAGWPPQGQQQGPSNDPPTMYDGYEMP